MTINGTNSDNYYDYNSQGISNINKPSPEDLFNHFIKAAEDGDQELLQRCIKQGVEINRPDPSGNTALHKAVEKGHVEAVKLLLQNKAELEAENYDYGYTPLQLACKNGSYEIAHLLLDNGAQVDKETKEYTQARLDTLNAYIPGIHAFHRRYTPLHIACQNSHTDLIKLLLDRGAKVDPKDCLENTPLHFATQKSDLQVMQLLLENKAQPNEKDKYGNTPLHMCINDSQWMENKEQFYKKVQLLIDNGAKLDEKNNSGKSPLKLAEKRGFWEILEFLRARSPENPSDEELLVRAFFDASQQKNKQAILESCLQQGVNINAVDEEGNTALHLAVDTGQIEVVQFLLNNGADITVKNNDGKTPLHCACEFSKANKHPEIILLLLALEGIDITVPDNTGTTPFHMILDRENYSLIKSFIDKKDQTLSTKNTENTTKPSVSSKHEGAAIQIQRAWRYHLRQKLKKNHQTFEKWLLSAVKGNRKAGQKEELERLKNKKNIDLSDRFVKPEIQMIYGRLLELKRLYYREGYYTFVHGQSQEWATVSEVFSQLMKSIKPTYDNNLFSYIRKPSDTKTSTIQYLETHSDINDGLLAKELLSTDTWLWRRQSGESTLYFIDNNGNVKSNIAKTIATILSSFAPQEKKDTVAEITRQIIQISNERQKACKVGGIFMICIPKKNLQNQVTDIVYRSEPGGNPLMRLSQEEEMAILDALQEDNSLIPTIDFPTQYRILAEQIRPEDGVRSFSISELSEDTVTSYQQKIAEALKPLTDAIVTQSNTLKK